MATYAPRHCDIWPWTRWYAHNYSSLTRTVDASCLGMGYLSCAASGATTGYIEWYVALDAGTWTLTYIYFASGSAGIAAVTLDGASLGSIDGYGGTGRNTVSSIAGFTVATAGVYPLRFATNTKHASSSNYNLFPQLITLTRTGA